MFKPLRKGAPGKPDCSHENLEIDNLYRRFDFHVQSEDPTAEMWDCDFDTTRWTLPLEMWLLKGDSNFLRSHKKSGRLFWDSRPTNLREQELRGLTSLRHGAFYFPPTRTFLTRVCEIESICPQRTCDNIPNLP